MEATTLKKAAFLTTRTALGFTHFALQSLADGVCEVEARIVQRTGVWDVNGNHHTNISKDVYKASRRRETAILQKQSIDTMRDSLMRIQGVTRIVKPVNQ